MRGWIGKRFGIISRPLERLKESILKPDYTVIDRMEPIHGMCLFAGYLAIFIGISFYLGPILSQNLADKGLALPVLVIQVPLLVYCLIYILAMKLNLKDLKIRTPAPLEWLIALPVALFALAGAIAILVPVLVIHHLISPGLLESSIEEAKALQEAITPDSGTQLLLHLGLIAVIPAVVEELFFRGLLFDSFMKLGPVWALTISSLAFGMMHLMPLRIPSLIFVGFVLGLFKYRTGKLTSSMLVHVIYNGIMVAITYAAKDLMDVDFDMFSCIGLG